MERFRDHTGSNQVMVHALFGRRVNAPLSLLLQHTARQLCGIDIGCVDGRRTAFFCILMEMTFFRKLLFKIEEGQARVFWRRRFPDASVQYDLSL